MALFKKKKKQTNTENSKDNSGRKKGLGQKILKLFKGEQVSEEFYEDLEELLISSDIGGKIAVDLTDRLRNKIKKSENTNIEDLLIGEFQSILCEEIQSTELKPEKGKLNCFLVLGVNGVGKTTTIAKLAENYKEDGFEKIVLAAGDTFRAAAIDQLKIHGERTGMRVVAQDHGADPGAVAFDAIASAKAKGEELILIDTAGRMHNRADLMKELQKIDKVIKTNLGENSIYKKILILDATTGQNGKHQAEVFNEAVGVDAVIMTKYDSTAKGGLIVTISIDPGLPFAFLGCGESKEDLKKFHPETYVKELLESK